MLTDLLVRRWLNTSLRCVRQDFVCVVLYRIHLKFDSEQAKCGNLLSNVILEYTPENCDTAMQQLDIFCSIHNQPALCPPHCISIPAWVGVPVVYRISCTITSIFYGLFAHPQQPRTVKQCIISAPIACEICVDIQKPSRF